MAWVCMGEIERLKDLREESTNTIRQQSIIRWASNNLGGGGRGGVILVKKGYVSAVGIMPLVSMYV